MKPLLATLTDHTNNKMTTKYFDNLLAEISKTGKPNLEDNEYISQFFIPINSTRNSILEEQDKIPEYLYFINSGFKRRRTNNFFVFAKWFHCIILIIDKSD
jgi:hypothetical protein